MKNLARGSIFLGLVALFAVLFYFQPTAEAKNVFSIAIDSEENVQPNTEQSKNQNNPTQEITQTIQTENQNENIINSEAVAEATTFRATAYCLKGRTASGGSVKRGVVAADPRVLPLGTRIDVDAGPYSGTYTVADTGGGVKGRKLDIWVPSCAEANRFGSRKVRVSVLSRKEKNRT